MFCEKRAVPRGGTIAPVIIASDKTQLTQFSGNKSAYPVYLTLGNLPKALRRKPHARACVLIAYLSVDKVSSEGLTKTALRLRNYELFHRSMAIVLQSLKAAGDPRGNGIEMVGGDGAVRRVYPILAAYVADYPEQCLVTCSKYGTCPKCQVKAHELGSPAFSKPRTQKSTYKIIREARNSVRSRNNGSNSVYLRSMENDVAGGKYDPFWIGLPLTDIHECITPDVLHQLYQGVLKHLIDWVQEIVGKEELDERIRALPPAFGVRHFKNGISTLSQVSGIERKHMARILLSCLVGKMDRKGIIACRSILHFINLAQYPSHDEETFGYMQAELDLWNKYQSYFIRAGIRNDFNIPKFHSLLHYIDSIHWLGATDNYNTEMFERLHIDFAKEGWRASNKRDHFPQMVNWLSRREKVASYDFYRSWVEESNGGPGEDESEGTSQDQLELSVQIMSKRRSRAGPTEIKFQLAKLPAEPRKSLARIALSHAAPGFIAHLKLFLVSLMPPDQQVDRRMALEGTLPFNSLDVWHQYKFRPFDLSENEGDTTPEVVRAIPVSRKSAQPRFDNVLVLDTDEAESTAVQGKILSFISSVSHITVLGCRVGRLRVIFRLPTTVVSAGFPTQAPQGWPKEVLAYVTWYTRFPNTPDDATLMYRIEPAVDSMNVPQGSVVFLSDIRQSCMLVPSKSTWDSSWSSVNILDKCSSFFVNNLQSKYSYQTIY